MREPVKIDHSNLLNCRYSSSQCAPSGSRYARERALLQTCNSGFGAHFSWGLGMNTVMLNLETSTLRAVVALCRITGDSLRKTFEDEWTDQKERRAIFSRWSQVRQTSFQAQEALDALPLL
jgi:hypothetical protein